MRSLTLILSDLYLPEEVARDAGIPATLDLPNLEWLLRFASRSVKTGDWRAWLATELNLPALAALPVAQTAAHAFLPPMAATRVWFATPVHFEARLDHVRLTDRGLLRVSAGEAAAWCQDFAREFGPGHVLHPGGERGFFLSGLATGAATADPARLLDADVANALPRGANAGELRRLGAEVEMWLHAAPLNAARESSRLPRISALWIWGGTGRQVPAVSQAALGRSLPPAFYGGDPFLAGLARELKTPPPAAPPANLAALHMDDERYVIEFAPASGAPCESLSHLDVDWFAPARMALVNGSLDALDIVANDVCFRVAKRPGWRWWRRRRGWLEMLRRDAGHAEA